MRTESARVGGRNGKGDEVLVLDAHLQNAVLDLHKPAAVVGERIAETLAGGIVKEL